MKSYVIVAMAALVGACGHNPDAGQTEAATQPDLDHPARAVEAEPDEPRLANLRMLTDGGENAEAYFSADARQLIFQATRSGISECDQIFTMDVDGRNVRMVSTGTGRTTCAYFFPAGDRILYSSTHEHSPECPPPVDRSQGHVWNLDPYDVFTARPDGSDLRRITSHAGYDAEATISPDGSRIVFTSTRDGNIDLYTMNADGSDVRRLTTEIGYNGGAFFSADGSKIVYRAAHPRTAAGFRSIPRAPRPQHRRHGAPRHHDHGRRRLQQAPRRLQRCGQLRALHAPGRPPHHLQLQHGDPSAGATSTSGSSTSTVPASSASRRIRTSTASPCSAPTAASSSSRPIVQDSNPGDTNVFIADWVD
jgi:dipeptidyl aminopeptidase/acylaminoacyl peptidase